MTDLTEYGVQSPHLPLPRERRKGVALCFSGGGYRAALFHLGATRRLNELGVLSKVDTFTAVSRRQHLRVAACGVCGAKPGRVVATGTSVAAYDQQVAKPMYELAGCDVRTRTVLRRLLPWNWRKANVQIDALADALTAGPTGRARLSDLPAGRASSSARARCSFAGSGRSILESRPRL